ncbi:hypothetical protein G7Z17_g12326 [Cylindrodendrum hubeiense]|uniref:Uncharacterized protein n=1 Tax=Cylindrodendrum hubeiense TaxID=595255 RepID=A0A9P5L9D8_9HYPO|nr:hypothetical protein G7Z17_g12326 [Cylindrodendrum hubeiense]
MLPCKFITVRLLEVEAPKHSPSPQLGRPDGNVYPQKVSVLHLSNSAKHSFIAKKFLQHLLRINYGRRASEFKINNDTLVHLEWKYPDLNHAEVTTHLVVRDSHFQIILRKQDWERPIRSWLRNFPEQQLREHGILQPRPKPEGESPKAETAKSRTESKSTVRPSDIGPEGDSETESIASESSYHPSRPSTATTTASVAEVCTSRGGSGGEDEDGATELGDEGRDEKDGFESNTSSGDVQNNEIGTKGGYYDDFDSDSEWPDIEVVETETEDNDLDDEGQKDAYWDWSPEKRRWFHENEDKSLVWFPRLV